MLMMRSETCILLREEDGGAGGIRTHDRLPYTRFPIVLLRPLGHHSAKVGSIVAGSFFFTLLDLPSNGTKQVKTTFGAQKPSSR